MEKSAPLVEIDQIAASIVINQQLDLEELSRTLNTPLSKLTDTSVLVYKFKEQNEVLFLVFSTGKMVCTGARSEKEVEQAVDSFMKILRYVGVKNTENPSFSVQNISALGRLGVELNLEAVVRTLENCRLVHKPDEYGERLAYIAKRYSLEPLPWLIHGLGIPRVVIVLFGSGKFVITRTKSEEVIFKVATKFKERMSELGFL